MAKPQSMGRTAASGAIYTGISQGVRVVLGVVSAVLVARLIAPAEFGVAAMVGPISGFVLIFQNFGLNYAAIQAKELTHEQASALFWVNVLASAVIAVVFLALAPLVTLFYGDPRAGAFTAASAATVLITGLSLQHSAQLGRHLRFRVLSVIDAVIAVVGVVATVIAAYIRRDYWALWIGTFATAIAKTILLWIVDDWKPSPRIDLAPAKPMLGFGAGLTGVNLLNFLSRNLDNVLIAKAWGAEAVGLYDRAYKLMMFPLQNISTPLSRVMVPVLARVREAPDRYRRAFLLATRALMIICTPGIAVAAAASDRLIPFLLGSHWKDASPIFFWLSLAALLQPLGNAQGWLFITEGRTKAFLQWSLFAAATTIIAFVIGLRWGPVGVAAAYFIAQILRLPLQLSWSVRGSPVRTLDLYGLLAPMLAGSVLAWGFVKLVSPHVSFPVLLAASLAFAYPVGTACHALTPSGRRALKELFDIGMGFVLSKRGGG